MKKQRYLKAPSSCRVESVQPSTDNDQRAVVEGCGTVRQLAAGRTLPRLLALMDLHFLQRPSSPASELTLRGGSSELTLRSATFKGRSVLIVGAFSRYRELQADVAPLREVQLSAGSPRWAARLAEVFTVPRKALEDVGVHYIPVPSGKSCRLSGKVLRFVKAVPHPEVQEIQQKQSNQRLLQFQAVRTQMTVWNEHLTATRGFERGFAASAASPVELIRAELKSHISDMAQRNEIHVAHKWRRDSIRLKHVLDVPSPIPIDASSWLCRTCHGRRSKRRYEVTDKDVQAAFPGTLISRHAKLKPAYMTPAFLLFVVQAFHDQLSQGIFCHLQNWCETKSFRQHKMNKMDFHLAGPVPKHTQLLR